ncbi:MAG: DMT family transporter [Flavobacteriales bacterium]|jgi:drug/metabolite transporter (DMT)-like permease|nr:DMT family transporter [Flavobacteriales bacterium]
MSQTRKKWILLLILSFIWGSSFILIKKGLLGLNPIQLGSLRIIFSGIILFIFGYKSFKNIPKERYFWVALSGFAGTFFPVYLFAYAETEIDSSIASVLNGTTPLFTLIFSVFIYKIATSKLQVMGVLLAFLGSLLLISEGFEINPDKNNYYTILVLIASVCYAINVNIIKAKLQHLKAIEIATGSFVLLVPISLIILWFSAFFETDFHSNPIIIESISYVFVLSIFGTALAKILFNKTVQISTPVFASSVTYLIPIFAIFWGVLDGEQLSSLQIISILIILGGIYLVNNKRK